MTQRIAPNNNLPATHFIEVWKGRSGSVYIADFKDIYMLKHSLLASSKQKGTVCIFRIRKNKLPTLHKF